MTQNELSKHISAYHEAVETQKNHHDAILNEIFNIVKERGNLAFKDPIHINRTLVQGAFFDTKYPMFFPEGRVSYWITIDGRLYKDKRFPSTFENNIAILDIILKSI